LLTSVSEEARWIFLRPPKLRPQKYVTMFTTCKRVYSAFHVTILTNQKQERRPRVKAHSMLNVLNM